MTWKIPFKLPIEIRDTTWRTCVYIRDIQTLILVAFATCTSPIINLIYTPEFFITFVSHFSWVSQPSQEKLKTMLMQNFEAQIRCSMGHCASGVVNEIGLVHDIIWRHWPSCLVIPGLFLIHYENPDFRLSRGLCTYVQLVCNNTCTFFWTKRWKLAVNQFS